MTGRPLTWKLAAFPQFQQTDRIMWKSLWERLEKRTSDPVRFLDAAAWVRPLLHIAPPAKEQEIVQAEQRLGFHFPSIVRQLYTEIGNGHWGPFYGFLPIPEQAMPPTENDLVGFYLECRSADRQRESPQVDWPPGLVTIIDRGCVAYELCDFLNPPYPVYLLDAERWTDDKPVTVSLTKLADSLESRIEQWLDS